MVRPSFAMESAVRLFQALEEKAKAPKKKAKAQFLVWGLLQTLFCMTPPMTNFLVLKTPPIQIMAFIVV